MTNSHIMKALLNERPNGVSFDPMAVRLLRKTIPLEDLQIEELKDEMFQLGNGRWFSLDMIADDETRRALQEQVADWVLESPCLSLGRLFESYCGVLHHISTLQDFATFLRKLGISVSEYGRGGFYCFKPTSNLGESLTLIAKSISEWQEDAGGMLALYDIEEQLPYLTAEALEDIRTKFLPEIHVEEVGGLPCWLTAEAVHLPEDFSEKITDAVDTLVELGKKVDTGNLEFALDLFYRIRFREAYNLTNRRVFISICAKHYNGTLSNKRAISRDFFRDWAEHHAVMQFPRRAPADPVASINGATGKRHRSPNTRFDNLGVPIGAELVFAKDQYTICKVLNDSNQVEFDGESWAISRLANHLLNASAENGFRHFCYEGELLWDRRLRLADEKLASPEVPPSTVNLAVTEGAVANEEQPSRGRTENCWNAIDSRFISSSEIETDDEQCAFQAEDNDREIIGLEGRPLKLATWRAFKSAGTDPRVAEWARRVEQGESVEHIARGTGRSALTVKEYIMHRRRYFLVCKKNGIRPEGEADV